jgi:cytochrome oxidase Cu insertion factor (SCO1/SenC/PrrC family)
MRSRVVWIAMELLCLLVVGAHSQASAKGSTASLIGAVYTPPVPAADFVLTDQHGMPFHMADMAGKVVVFSFIYTHCADTCPYLSMKLKVAHGMLGTDATRTGFVAVTTDPQRDTLQVIASYSKEMGLFDTWHFVTGVEQVPGQRDGECRAVDRAGRQLGCPPRDSRARPRFERTGA